MLFIRVLGFILIVAVSASSMALGQPTTVPTTISQSTTWTVAGSPYVISNTTIQSGVTVTLEPGTVIKFRENGYLNASGTLLAEGTEALPIVFTSLKDDTYGGDTDGEPGAPAAGYWGYIRLNSSSSAMKHCVIKYGGSSGNPAYTIYLYAASPVIENCTISDNDGIASVSYGIRSYNGAPIIKNNTISSNGRGIWIDGTSAPTIINNTITNHEYGIVCEASSKPSINGNLFDSNTTSIHLASVFPSSLENNSFSNTTNEIQLYGTGKLLSDQTIPNDLHITGGTLDLNGKKLSITGDLSLNSCSFYVDGGALLVTGNLEITGTGRLRMVNPLDLVEVDGNALFNGASTSTYLTEGVLKVAGNFTQAGDDYAFRAGENHQVILDGSGLQLVTFEDPSYSYFQNVNVANTSSEGVVFVPFGKIVAKGTFSMMGTDPLKGADEASWEALFDMASLGNNAAPAFGDLDGDGDQDLLVGQADGTIRFYENVMANSRIGKMGLGKNFTGANFGRIPDASHLGLGGTFTVELWFKVDRLVSTWAGILGKSTGSTGGRNFTLWLHSDGHLNFSYHNASNAEIHVETQPGTISLGKWHHVAAVLDVPNTIMKIYLDGVEAASGMPGGYPVKGTSPVWVGRNCDSKDMEYLFGMIDEVRISDVVRYSSSFTSPSTPFVPDGNTLALWHLDEIESLTIEDASSYNHSGLWTPWSLGSTKYLDIDVVNYARPVLADMDADGDLDLLVGTSDGILWRYMNDGNPYRPSWRAGEIVRDEANAVMMPGVRASPAFADIDDDGKQELFVGYQKQSDNSGAIAVYRNVGTAASHLWELMTDRFAGITLGVSPVEPRFVDLDRDGDYDLFVGQSDGTLIFFKNIGTKSSPVWALPVYSYGSIDIGSNSVPAFVDLGYDGLEEMVIGSSGGNLFMGRNIGLRRITINDGNGVATGRNVTVSLNGQGMEVAGYFLSSNDAVPTENASGWVNVTPTSDLLLQNLSYDVGEGSGEKRVYVWFKDSAGSISNGAYDTIRIESPAPSLDTAVPAQFNTAIQSRLSDSERVKYYSFLPGDWRKLLLRFDQEEAGNQYLLSFFLYDQSLDEYVFSDSFAARDVNEILVLDESPDKIIIEVAWTGPGAPQGSFTIRLDTMATVDAGKLLWSSVTGGAILSPSVSGNRVYVTSADGYLYCMDVESGNTVWAFKMALYGTSPAISGGKVFIGDGRYSDGNLYCLDAQTGVKLWQYNAHGAIFYPPALSHGKVFVGTGYSSQKILCLDAETGTLLWEYQAGECASSAAVYEGKIYVGIGSYDAEKVLCLDAETGSKIWEYETGSAVESSPAVSGGRVYVAAGRKVYCLSADTGSKIWEYETGSTVESSPAVYENRVYVGSNDYKVYCLDALTGAKVWEFVTGYTVSSSPAISGGKVYISISSAVSLDKKVYCLDAQTGIKLWSYEIGESHSPPVVSGGKLFVGNDSGTLFCLDAGDPEAAPWPMFHHDLQRTGDSGYSTTEVLYGFIQVTPVTEISQYALQVLEVYEDRDVPIPSGVQFAVSDPSKASVSGNRITALRNGRVTVAATYDGRQYERSLFLMLSPDAYEKDNDTKDQANPLAPGQFLKGDMVGGTGPDTDYFKITLTQNSLIEIAYLAEGNMADTTLELFDEAGNLLASQTSLYGVDRILSCGLLAGTYYLKLTPAGDVDQSSSYYIAYVIMGTFGPKEPIEVDVGQSKEGTVYSRTDATYFRFSLSETNNLNITFSPTSLTADYQIELLDKDENVIKHAITGNARAVLMTVGLRPGDYSFKVTCPKDVDAGHPFSVSLAESSQSYEIESNDTYQAGTNIEEGISVQGVVDDGDVDFYSFALRAPRYLKIGFEAETYGTEYLLTLYKENDQNPIDSTVCQKGSSALIEVGLTGGNYFVKVQAVGEKESYPRYTITRTQSLNTQLEIESNNTLLFANALDSTHPKQGRIYSASDVDFYGFYVPEETLVIIAFSAAATTADYKVSLTNGEQTSAYQKASINGQAVTLERMLLPGNYYVKIEAGGDVNPNASYSLSTTTVSLVGVKSLAGLSLNAGVEEVGVGKTLQVNAIGNYSDATQAPVNGAIWSSSDNGIATVSQSGVVKGIKDGYVTIYASVGGVMGQMALTVGAGEKPAYQTRGNLILVAGGGIADSNTLRESTQYLADMVYGRFVARGFESKDMYYFNPMPWHDINGDGYGDPVVSDESPTVGEVRWAIENWAVNQASTGPLYVVLINHGGMDSFEVFPGEVITAGQLKQSLSVFEGATGRKVVVVIEACKSGSFGNDLGRAGSAEMVVTCTDEGNAYLEMKGRISFTQFLMDSLLGGDTLRQGYLKAKSRLMNCGRPYSLMNPQLVEGVEYLVSQERLGGNFAIAGLFPEIVEQTEDLAISAKTTQTFTVKISDLSGQTKVWAVVEPPEYKVPEVVGDLEAPAVSLPSIELVDAEVGTGVLDGVYVGSYGGFEYNGEYRVVFYARNADGLVSVSPATVVVVSGGKEIVRLVGDVNDDEKVDLRDVILVLQVMADVKTGVVMNRQGDVNGDGRMDLRDAIYILQTVGGLR